MTPRATVLKWHPKKHRGGPVGLRLFGSEPSRGVMPRLSSTRRELASRAAFRLTSIQAFRLEMASEWKSPHYLISEVVDILEAVVSMVAGFAVEDLAVGRWASIAAGSAAIEAVRPQPCAALMRDGTAATGGGAAVTMAVDSDTAAVSTAMAIPVSDTVWD